MREGTRLAFGKPVNPVYHFEQADVIVSLDSDFLSFGSGTHALYARFFVTPKSGGRSILQAQPPLCGGGDADDDGFGGGSSPSGASD